MKVRVLRKFAHVLNGIDLSKAHAGDELELSARDAELLIAEGWAAPVATADDKEPRNPTDRRSKRR